MKTLVGCSRAAIALSMLLLAGCGGKGDSFPDNSMEINGRITPITSVRIVYWEDWRGIAVQNATGEFIKFDFDSVGLGDPTQLANHFPLGRWTTFTPTTFDWVGISDPEGWRLYDSATSYSGALRLGGTPGTTITVEANWTFTSEPVDEVRVKYSGTYAYVSDE